MHPKVFTAQGGLQAQDRTMADVMLVQVGERAGEAVRHAGNPGCPELQPGRPAAAQQHLQVGLLRQGRPLHALQHQRVRLRHDRHHPARCARSAPTAHSACQAPSCALCTLSSGLPLRHDRCHLALCARSAPTAQSACQAPPCALCVLDIQFPFRLPSTTLSALHSQLWDPASDAGTTWGSGGPSLDPTPCNLTPGPSIDQPRLVCVYGICMA